MTAPGPVMFWEEEDDPISERAADFLERRRFGGWSAADQTELDAWLAESTLHRVAYLRVEGIAARADRFAALRALKRRQGWFGGGRLVQRRFVLPFLAAASIALMAALGIPFVISLTQPPDRIDSTDVGGRTLLSFSDRTQIELNTDTAMRFRMTTAERTVWLEKGEAWFHVSHDAAHPFTVVVGRHRITDLGTEFVVRRDADNVDVALLNGRAALSAAGMQMATLNPGDEVIATPVSLSVTRKTQQQLADALAWRQGMLVFRNTRLAEVVKEFNRYNATRLVIADPSVADEKITAELKTGDYVAFLNLTQTLMNLRADREGNEILISRERGEETKRAVRVKHSL
jgi:transmembrane sensor